MSDQPKGMWAPWLDDPDDDEDAVVMTPAESAAAATRVAALTTARDLAEARAARFSPAWWRSKIAKDFNPDEPRDEQGRWSSGGGGYPAKNASETDKGYLKRVKDQLPAPSSLPEDHGRYFNMDKATAVVGLDQLVPTKSEADRHQSGINAGKFMRAAYDGAVARRDPISVARRADGKYQVLDGNSTYTAALHYGWKTLPIVEAAGKMAKDYNPDEPRDEHGMWTSGGGGGTGVKPEEHALPKEASQPISDKGQLFAALPKANDELRTWLNKGAGVAAQLGFRSMNVVPEQLPRSEYDKPGGMFFVAPIKSEASAADKVKSEYTGDWSKLLDGVRCTFAVDSMSDVKRVVGALRDSGMELARAPKDTLSQPTDAGYRALLLNPKLPSGIIGEIQIVPKPMLFAKGEGHAHYEVMRSIARGYMSAYGKTPKDQWASHDRATYDAYDAASKKLYDEAWARFIKGS